ncbi:hypothetical protein ACLI09_09640 [Flavobacterium sp. RHBU_24]|uniref:hypothetical protein n=1 Tax=Flavobacterium sp. RHBU_24 TaxID=3391185 RepID=UPI003984D957
MKKFIFLATLSITLFSCKNEASTPVTTIKDTANCAKPKGKEFEMYRLSEMAALMEQMYVENSQLKERIEKGGAIGKFPEHILKIHTAKLTDPDDNDAFFKDNAAKFITAQRLIYSDTINVKQHFNEGVDACITCHKGKCGGPIARIKKLYIK